jgi:hypothetical protein
VLVWLAQLEIGEELEQVRSRWQRLRLGRVVREERKGRRRGKEREEEAETANGTLRISDSLSFLLLLPGSRPPALKGSCFGQRPIYANNTIFF